MRTDLLIGLAAGLASAVVFASAGIGPLPVRALLFALSPLPIYFAGLAWGWAPAAVAGVIGSVLVGIISTHASGAIAYIAAEAAPAILLTYFATLYRAVPATPSSSAAVEWYPVGRLVLIAAFVSALLALLTLAMVADSRDSLVAMLKRVAADVIEQQSGKRPDDKTANDIAAILYQLLPFASAVSWMGTLLLNLWVAGRIAASTGRMQRPWPDIPSTAYPPGTPLLLAGATALSMLGGDAGRIGAAFAGSMFFAYVLVGLAIVHFVTRGQPWRPFVLWALYLALVVLNTAASVLIAILGLAESFSRFRRTPPPARPGPPPSR